MFKTLMTGLQASDWGMALDFLSPDFFKVVPTLGMTRLLTELSRNFVKSSLASETRLQWAPTLEKLDEGLRFGTDLQPADREAEHCGQVILKLYFASIIGPKPCFLDLRSQAFSADASGLLWNPQPWVFSFSADFRLALQHIYQGFYENQPELFESGLRSLDLLHSKDLFLALFGRVQNGAMNFHLQDFRSSFHQIFLSCRQHKTTLHPEFLPLGLLLFGLYEHAEKLSVPLFPGKAWKEASKECRIGSDEVPA